MIAMRISNTVNPNFLPMVSLLGFGAPIEDEVAEGGYVSRAFKRLALYEKFESCSNKDLLWLDCLYDALCDFEREFCFLVALECEGDVYITGMNEYTTSFYFDFFFGYTVSPWLHCLYMVWRRRESNPRPKDLQERRLRL